MKFFHLSFEGWCHAEIIWVYQQSCRVCVRLATYWVMWNILCDFLVEKKKKENCCNLCLSKPGPKLITTFRQHIFLYFKQTGDVSYTYNSVAVTKKRGKRRRYGVAVALSLHTHQSKFYRTRNLNPHALTQYMRLLSTLLPMRCIYRREERVVFWLVKNYLSCGYSISQFNAFNASLKGLVIYRGYWHAEDLISYGIQILYFWSKRISFKTFVNACFLNSEQFCKFFSS